MSVDLIARAVEILRAGGLVAFPTETVYGLGADATNADAVRRIFAGKGRPPTNPVIVHVADEKTARRYAGEWPANAARLAGQFWPGPLTIVVPRSKDLAIEVSAGGQTVGLRSPDHPIALELLSAFDGAIAAPSANRSTRISPTLARHVREELGNAVDLILDGGACRVGIESTVLDLSGSVPTILRQGAVTREHLESTIGKVDIFSGSVDPTIAATSPGQHAIHYAPKARAYRFHRNEIKHALKQDQSKLRSILWIDPPAHEVMAENVLSVVNVLPNNPTEYARRLYAALREADGPGVNIIFVEMPPDTPEWAAVRDRLSRATLPL